MGKKPAVCKGIYDDQLSGSGVWARGENVGGCANLLGSSESVHGIYLEEESRFGGLGKISALNFTAVSRDIF